MSPRQPAGFHSVVDVDDIFLERQLQEFLEVAQLVSGDAAEGESQIAGEWIVGRVTDDLSKFLVAVKRGQRIGKRAMRLCILPVVLEVGGTFNELELAPFAALVTGTLRYSAKASMTS